MISAIDTDQVYDIGDVVRIYAKFRIEDTGCWGTPTTLTVRIKPPSGTTLVYTYGTDAEIELNDDNEYEYITSISPSRAGIWYWRVIATGDAAGATQGSFTVRKSMA